MQNTTDDQLTPLRYTYTDDWGVTITIEFEPTRVGGLWFAKYPSGRRNLFHGSSGLALLQFIEPGDADHVLDEFESMCDWTQTDDQLKKDKLLSEKVNALRARQEAGR